VVLKFPTGGAVVLTITPFETFGGSREVVLNDAYLVTPQRVIKTQNLAGNKDLVSIPYVFLSLANKLALENFIRNVAGYTENAFDIVTDFGETFINCIFTTNLFDAVKNKGLLFSGTLEIISRG